MIISSMTLITDLNETFNVFYVLIISPDDIISLPELFYLFSLLGRDGNVVISENLMLWC